MKENVKVSHILDAIKVINDGKEIGLRAFAEALEVPATRLYAKAKTPIAGQVYNPDAINWDSLNEYFLMKLAEKDATITTLEQLVTVAKEKEIWLAEHKAVRATAGKNLIDVDGDKMPARKAAIFEMGSEKESLVCFKHDPAVYRMVYQTLGYTCIRAVNSDGSFAKEEVRVISNGTLNTKCVPPMTMAQAIKDRFSGVYAEQIATAVPTKVDETATADAPVAESK